MTDVLYDKIIFSFDMHAGASVQAGDPNSVLFQMMAARQVRTARAVQR